VRIKVVAGFSLLKSLRWNGRRSLSALTLCGVSLLGAPSLFGDDKAVITIDFSRTGETPTYRWLEERDFKLQKHATDPDKIEFYHTETALHIVAKKPAFGMAVHEGDVPGVRSMRLHWGVSEFPEGASYQHGVDNEAIMVYVFFGHKKMPSGELLVPNSPYFIGFYLCQPGTDATEQPYVGHHYKKTGRYICVDHPPKGEAVATHIDLAQEFRNSFGLDDVPTVSGISIEVDTTDAENDGHAAAFLQKMEFFR
jgi:hypothetical protein